MVNQERFDRFTQSARKVFQYAQEEALNFNQNFIGPEHLLLGLLRSADTTTAAVLVRLEVDAQQVRAALEARMGRRDQQVITDIGLTPRAKRVIELAVEEARSHSHHYIGSEHLLLGLLREGSNMAAQVLADFQVTLERVRAATLKVLAERPRSEDDEL